MADNEQAAGAGRELVGPGMHARAWRWAWLTVLGVSLGFAAALWMRMGGPGHGADPLARFLIAVAVIMAVFHLLGATAHRLGQPRVFGEILGGLILGPSILGAFLPTAEAWLFPVAVRAPLSLVSQLGLAVFMFLLGSELKFSKA